ncbi:hypothetical protein B0H13DRAFT_2229941 [Mycena leptocephala]|nr:hypothetical protein B0H13DRAFT_2229941 [Mycena leptocephala]
MRKTAEQIWGPYVEVYTLPKHRRRKTSKAAKSTPASQQVPRRGPFYAKSVGVSMGGGQEAPKAFVNGAINMLLLTQLMATEPFRRIAGFVNTYAPALHGHYHSTMEALYNRFPHLPRNYDEFTSVFAAATFNFGPWTITFPHLDFANLAWDGFDPDKGGHLILWDLRLVIRFPPGSTILIPSAILRHSNVAIQQGETRYSFTQYTAAGIFRYVYNGFPRMRRWSRKYRKMRWLEGMKMYSKWQ